MTWIDDAAKAIKSAYCFADVDPRIIAEVIAKFHERHIASTVPVDLAKLMDEAQAEQRRLTEERDAWRELAEIYLRSVASNDMVFNDLDRIRELKAKLGVP